ncbi:MAG TPA: fructosamine kinase family protein [Gracilimonas sp.]|uniref:fructosamine kinase family protein n=1 Tax=Gracilimonas sp. TaxID=1974203 RepID=UPI002DB50548|nr:fructosamine kinase family protein [Gracilimonas sp.]
MLPKSIQNIIEKELGDKIKSVKSVLGGDINTAYRLTFESDQTAFLKTNEEAPPSMFQAESKGLKLLNSAGTELTIPNVLLLGDNFLLLEWIKEGCGKPGSAYNFGVELAKLHKTIDSQFGLDQDNYIGRLPQSNTQHNNWPDFFAIERIEPQIKMGIESDKLNRSVLKEAVSLYKKLGSIFPKEQPALLHGDLWSGNYKFTQKDSAGIYDPAVYYGHREMDISMTRLFGGFSADFYSGYNDEYPLEPGYEDRIKLCNLYPVLVHANLFGGSYSRQAEKIIKNYA